MGKPAFNADLKKKILKEWSKRKNEWKMLAKEVKTRAYCIATAIHLIYAFL